MREIKFRAWDCGCKHMLSHEDIIDYMSDGNTIISLYFNGHLPDLRLMQYTGLKDKNGKEIWEGDILELKIRDAPDIRQDVFFHENGYWALRTGEETSYNLCLVVPEKMWSVIGNIHEKPELLEGKHDNNSTTTPTARNKSRAH